MLTTKQSQDFSNAISIWNGADPKDQNDLNICRLVEAGDEVETRDTLEDFISAQGEPTESLKMDMDFGFRVLSVWKRKKYDLFVMDFGEARASYVFKN